MDKLPPYLKLKILGELGNDLKRLSTTPVQDRNPISKVIDVKSIDKTKLSFFSQEDIITLQERGFIVKDGFLGDSKKIQESYNEVVEMDRNGDLRTSGMRLRKGSLQDTTRSLHSLRLELDNATNLNCKRVSMQVALYPGGGSRYVKHIDAVSGGPQRRITCLLYLNHAWKSTDGGQLRLYPPLTSQKNISSSSKNVTNKLTKKTNLKSEQKTVGDTCTSPEYVDVDPIGDRVVVFLSGCVEHEVIAAKQKRAALTMWLY
ncbi:hypothetical protein AAMO2058_000458900 [Amorphochlora amoebiformis]